MPHTLNVYALPAFADPQELAGGVAVVIDVLRATTTIAYALEAGAREVIPCLEVDEARAMADNLPKGEAVLGGERGGVAIPGFDLANSPEQFTPQRVAGKTVIFTTTNGTAAMVHARRAARILAGAFVNVTAVAGQLAGCEQIHLICAGTRGRYGADDILLAGMLAERLRQQGGIEYHENPQAVMARESWLATFTSAQARGAEPLEPRHLAEALRNSAGGQNLLALGLEKDILAAAQIDRFARVPELDPATFRIRLCDRA